MFDAEKSSSSIAHGSRISLRAGARWMGALIRVMDCERTPLGLTQTWPASLCTSVSIDKKAQ